MSKRKLPTGLASFKELRNKGCYYVDKTRHIKQLLDDGKYYFLSRPRRFGKSLLLSTLKELFEGNEELFQGLYIHDHWDWSTKHPVIRLSFGGSYYKPHKLNRHINRQLTVQEKFAGLKPSSSSGDGDERLQEVISNLYEATGEQVVVLVDEYDKPILDLLENPQQAENNRKCLHGLYGIIKDCDDLVRFVFVTGISMYSKVSLFSGMNNLEDISLDPEFATICGYTDKDIDTVFAPELEGLNRSDMQRWYNGYDWLGSDKVYNPYDILLLFKKRLFQPYWYETGTPRFLYRMMVEGVLNTLDLENLEIGRAELSRFEIERIRLNPLLFQCGYLTIKNQKEQPDGIYYRLDYPNQEVRLSLNRELVDAVSSDLPNALKRGRNMARFLATNEFDEFEMELHSFFSAIPNQWYTHSGMHHYEGYYAGMIYACFSAIGLDIIGEESSSLGRSDLVLLHDSQVFVLEFKMVQKADVETEAMVAIEQIRQGRYADKYRNRREKIHLLAVLFNSEDRNVMAMQVEAD